MRNQFETDATAGIDTHQVPLANYGHPVRSEVLDWLPVLAALSVASWVLLDYCPVPPVSRSIPLESAAVVTLTYLLTAIAAASSALVLACLAAARHLGRRKLGPGVFARLIVLVAWLAPTVCFFVRGSLWAVAIGPVAAALGAAFLLVWGRELKPRLDAAETPAPKSAIPSPSPAPVLAGSLLLHLTAAATVAGFARSAAATAALAVFLINWRRWQLQPDSRPASPTRLQSIALTGIAALFAFASFTPYLAAPSPPDVPVAVRQSGSSGANPSPLQHASSSASSAVTHAQSSTWIQSALSVFRKPGSTTATGAFGAPKSGTFHNSPPYPILQALFGDQVPTPTRKSRRQGQNSVDGEPDPGVILRPRLAKQVTFLMPRPPSRRQFGGDPRNRRRQDPLSIPFYGAYWYFRTADGTLPPDATESRGDAADLEFQAADHTPVSMEARQHFGSPIDLSCCQTIEVYLKNGDRRPNTVAVELVLRDTRSQGAPSRSLGRLPVLRTLRWFPGDQRPPVPEVLRFRVPAHLGLASFDEAILRFDLTTRSLYSARIGIEKFRLIPPGE